MKVLVLTAFYPIPNGTHERMFVHVRNLYYKKCGIDVRVLNFNAKNDYEIDGIPVITLEHFKASRQSSHFDVVISHSANVRNHYFFLKKYEKIFDRLIFFFHGHEVLYLTKDYPEPYPYEKSSKWHRKIARYIYDILKIKLWANYYKKLAFKSDFIFVSEWLHKHFCFNLKISDSELKDHIHIINNSIGSTFESESYDYLREKKYDFISIRSNLDGSKYCVDLFVKYALNNPQASFLLIGKGKYFDYIKLPTNIEWVNKTIDHEKMIDYINSSRCALMLTREDTQGVMTCEMESFGIPVITSDIDVCHEFFDGRNNIKMISNDNSDSDIIGLSSEMASKLPVKKDESYYAKNTIQKEVDLLFSRVPRGV